MSIKEHQAARTALMEIRGAGYLHSVDLQMKRLAIALEAILGDLEYMRSAVDELREAQRADRVTAQTSTADDAVAD